MESVLPAESPPRLHLPEFCEMNSRSIGSDIGQFAGQVEKGHLLAAAATATSAATNERKSHNDNKERNANVPIADTIQLYPIIYPEQLEVFVTEENYYNQLLVHFQQRLSVELQKLNTANLPVNFATFKKAIFHEEYIKNILLLCCAYNENLANKLLKNSELYEAILKLAHFKYFTNLNFRKVYPVRLKDGSVSLKKKFTFEAETAKDNGNAVNVGDSLAEAESRINPEKTQVIKAQAAKDKENAVDLNDSLPAVAVQRKSTEFSSHAEILDN